MKVASASKSLDEVLKLGSRVGEKILKRQKKKVEMVVDWWIYRELPKLTINTKKRRSNNLPATEKVWGLMPNDFQIQQNEQPY